MAINFNDKVLVTNPTSFNLGRAVMWLGIFAIAIGAITHFTGDILLPAMAWCALGMPMMVIGLIVRNSGVRRN